MNTAIKPHNRLHHILSSPWLHLIAGLLLMVTSGIEIIETLDELFKEQSNIGAHHGLFFYSLVTSLNKLAEVMEGAISLSKATQSHEEDASHPPV
ncbi:MAG: hypothetical protein G8345_14265 [Magnetococcales bacterium]|nr:hypothetical protein [Magnetococcales bacterium]NGZ28042.1 hypothetical protein [Magnetococcales bacterium]